MKNETKQLFADAINAGQIKLWEDPGHGWLQVPLPLVKALQDEKQLKVSGYSYRDKAYAYLEEDCDLTAFANCFPWMNFRDLFDYGRIQTEHKENIFIRSLKNF